MKRITIIIIIVAVLLAGGIGFFFGRNLGGGSASQIEVHTASDEPKIWTCSMHPQIQQPNLGDCPICGMDLIPLQNRGSHDLGPRTLEMGESAVALANIQTSQVERRFPKVTVSLVGQIVHDETRLRSLSARFPARIDELFVNYTGVRVAQGEHLAMVYSPELLTAQRELLAAWNASPESTATVAARVRLRQWDLLPEQIEAIIQEREPSDHFELKSPISGTVIRRYVSEGDYVQTGEPMFQIADLSHLWLMLEAFESDLATLRYGQPVEFAVEADPGETFKGNLAFIAPEVDQQTRTVAVRVNVLNLNGRLRPGMLARAHIKTFVGIDGTTFSPELAGKWISPMHPEIIKDAPGQCDVSGMDLVPAESLGIVVTEEKESPLVVPVSAVLRTGQRAVVYVQAPETEVPTFEGREVVLGSRAGDFFVVKEGLEEGERVVTKGAFKLDSSLQIQAKPSMMNPSLSKDEQLTNKFKGAELTISPNLANAILPVYLNLQSALAADDFTGSQATLREMMEITGHQGALSNLIHTMLTAEELDSIRRPHFEALSMALIDTIREAPGNIGKSVYLMHCPMVYSNRGADWLQANDELLNPYFGAIMLKCGTVVERLAKGFN